jgi:D-hydroxyproline dehydrogenase subunit alpha
MTTSAEPVAVTVIGAGPAGLAAAVEVARSALSVTLIDAGSRYGGQFWRHGSAGIAADVQLHHDLDTFIGLSTQVEQFIGAGRIRYLPTHHVWSVGADDSGCTVGAIDRSDPTRPSEVVVRSDYLVLAAGAFDRQLPFPGWDLPGVMTIGAAQALLKGNGVVVGPRVVIAGTGPFLLPVAATLAVRGARVAGVFEANHPAGWLRRLPALVAHPRRIAEAAGYLAVLARRGSWVRNRAMVVAAHGTDRLEAVTVAGLDRHGNRRVRACRRIPADVLAVGYGFSTQSELPSSLGCQMQVTADQTLAVVTDDNQATTNPRVYAAGEITGVGGAQLAVAEGAIAGAAVVHAAGGSVGPSARAGRTPAIQRRRLRRFAAAMHAVYPVPPAWIGNLESDTIVCRCEEVTVAEIDDAIDCGGRDARTVKLLSRAGMGWCQGRECGYATAVLIAHRTGQPADLASGAERHVAVPIPLGLVAGRSPSTDSTHVS